MANYIDAMVTTVQVSDELLRKLKQRKMYVKESYEEVIWDLIEDTAELSDATKKHIAQAEQEFRKGKVHTHEQVKKALRL